MRHSLSATLFIAALSTALFACAGEPSEENNGDRTSQGVAIGEPNPNGPSASSGTGSSGPATGSDGTPNDPATGATGSPPSNPADGTPSSGGSNNGTPTPTPPHIIGGGGNPSGGPSTTNKACGSSVCGAGMYCCDPLHGICVKFGQMCTQ